MLMEASSGRSKKDIRDHCERLKMRATSQADAEFLSMLYRVSSFGGVIKVTLLDGTEWEEEFAAASNRRSL